VSVDKSALADPRSAETMPQLIRAAATVYGDDVAIIMKDGDVQSQSLTFAELDRQSAEIARGLIARGVGKGSRIGFIYGNSPTFALLLAAVARIGAIAVPISTLIKSNELVRVLRQSDVMGLFVQRSFLGNDYVERLCDALPELRQTADPDLRISKAPYLRWIVCSGPSLPPSFRDMHFVMDAAGTVDEALLLEIEAEVHPADQMVEIYTSGSMALPKGVKHNHGPVLFRTHYMRSMTMPKRGQEITVQLPMFWVGGLMMYLLPNWEVGAISVCTERTLSSSRIAMGSVLAADDIELIKQNRPYWGLGMSETLGPYSWGGCRAIRSVRRSTTLPSDTRCGLPTKRTGRSATAVPEKFRCAVMRSLRVSTRSNATRSSRRTVSITQATWASSRAAVFISSAVTAT